MKTLNNPDVICTAGSGSFQWSQHQWLVALESLYTARANEGEGPHLTIQFRPFCPHASIHRLLLVLNGEAVGMASLVTRRNGTGISHIGTVEDVYLLPPYRGQGLSRRLMEAVIYQAMQIELAWLELASKPRPRATNRLYQSLGFMLVAKANPDMGELATNHYRLTLQC